MTDRPASLTTPPEGYADWLADLKTRIHSAQQRAALAVNRELVLLSTGRLAATFWSGKATRAGAPRSSTAWRTTCAPPSRTSRAFRVPI